MADRDIFFGRNQETIELTSLIKAHPEVLLYAPSGAGKTSLLFAQVLPILESEEDFDMLPPARVRSQESAIIPDQKVNNIYVFNALKDLSNDTLSVIERARLTLAEFLAKQPRAVSGEWERQSDRETPERRLPRVVIFDQFEEIFTLYPERYKDREDFFVQVAAALEADQFLRVVFSMREDYIAELDPYVDHLPQGLRTRFRLERLRKSNALASVKRPLEADRCKQTRRQFEAGAAEALVDRLLAIKVKAPSGEKIEVPGEFVDPVQLQVVCQTLWEKLPPDDLSIGLEDIDRYANVDEALLDFYETSIRKAVIAANNSIQATLGGGGASPTPAQITEFMVRGWFEQKLITRENKRSMVNRERQTTAGLANIVVDELENQHLIRVEMRGGEPWYELSHDRFIAPIRESNRRFLLQQPLAKRKAQELEQRAEEWWNAERDASLLLNRGELADAENWMRTEAAAIGYSHTLYSFVQASETAIQHEDALQQQALTDALQQKAVAEHQRSRQFKRGLAATCVLLLLTLTSTGFAVNRWRTANRKQADAWRFYAQAKKSEEIALAETNRAVYQSQLAQENAEKLRIANTDLTKQKQLADEATEHAKNALAVAKKEKAAANIARQQTEKALECSRQANDQLSALTNSLKDSRNKAYSLTAAAGSELALTTNSKELALLLALKATDEDLTRTANNAIEPPEQAKAAVRRAWLKFSESRDLKGHQNTVWKAVYGPNGQVFTISEDGTARIWSKDLRGSPTVLDVNAPIHDLAVTPEGNYLATEQMNNEGSIWNLRDPDAKAIVLKGLTGPVATLAFSPDGKLLVTEATDLQDASAKPGAAPHIWEVASGQVRAVLRGHQEAVSDVAFSPNGQLVGTASLDGTARTWDARTGQPKAVFKNHRAQLTSIAFDPTGRFVVTASFDGTARVWDAETGAEKCALVGHEGVVISAVFSPDGKQVLTAGKQVNNELPGVGEDVVDLPPEVKNRVGTRDNTARIWNAETGQLILVLRGHTSDVNQASYNSDGTLIVTASADGTAKLWSTRDGLLVGELKKGGSVTMAAFSADDKSVLVAGKDNEASVWRVPSISETVVTLTPQRVTSLRFNTDSELVVASTDSTVHFKSLSSRSETVVRLPGSATVSDAGVNPAAGVRDVAVSPDKRYLVTASAVTPAPNVKRDYEAKKEEPDDVAAHVWDLETRSALPDLKGHQTPVLKVVFSESGKSLLTVSTDRVQVWQVRTWQKLKVLQPLPSSSELKAKQQTVQAKPGEEGARVLAAAFTEDENQVLVVDETPSLQAWDIATDSVRRVQFPLENRWMEAAFNRTATRIVTASYDGYLRVWTTEGKNISTLVGGDDVTSFAFSNDDRLVAAGLFYGGVQVWETATGQPIAELSPPGFTTLFRAIAFDPTNSSIVAATSRGVVKAFECEACMPFPTILQLARQNKTRELTTDELNLYVPGIGEVAESPQKRDCDIPRKK